MKLPIRAHHVLLGLVVFMLMMTPVISDARTYRPFRLPKEMFSLALSAIIVALFIAVRDPRREWALKRHLLGPLLPAWLTVVWAALGVFVWGAPGSNGLALLQLVVHVCLLAVLTESIRNRAQVSWLLAALLLPLSVSGGYAIIQFYGLDPWFSPLRDMYQGRWLAGGWIGQPTLLGGVLGPAIPLIITWLLVHRGLGHTLAAGTGFVLVLTGLMATHTRAVFLALLVMMPVQLALLATHTKSLLLQRRRMMFTLLLATCAVLLPFVMQSSTFVEKMTKLSQFRTDSAGARLFYWRVTAEMAMDRPVLGFGLGSYGPVFYDYQTRVLDQGTSLRAYMWELVQHAHNEFIQIAGELGAIGAFFACWFIAAACYAGWRNLVRANQEKDKALLIGCMAAVGVLIIDALFSFPFHIVPSAQCSVLLAACLIGNWAAVDGEQRQ